ncbi:APC family permease [Lactobacillus sp. ESL0679]|uniref:APC family permease n=1 Tax=Lactobacillus sp. ESL0679 TaxID=2983209 RepID=UPI0023F9A65B|nr:APC family permease [Lactobacillus sp. ESL0679]
MGLVSLTLLSLGSIIGSGWLFGAGEGAHLAGPAAIFSWLIGAVIMGFIAIVYTEMGTMFQQSGGMSRFAQYTHGSLLGFIAAWANWVSLETILPIEAVAAVQYLSSWPWPWARGFHQLMHHGQITGLGLLVVFAFMGIFTWINYYSVNLMARFSNTITWFKIIIPTLTFILLLMSGFNAHNLALTTTNWFPNGTAPILTATTSAGIIFSYDAFQTVINLGSEIENPQKNMRRAIIISLGLSALLYTLLQFTFVASMPHHLIQVKGWSGINFNSPFAQLAVLLGLNWLSILLYIDAFVSPFGTGIAFMATTSRSLAAMAENRHLPQFLTKLDAKYHTPHKAMLASLIVSIILVTLFPNWGQLASVIATSTLIAYLTGPVSTAALRKLAPKFNRPIKLRHLKVLAPITFVLTSLAVYWGQFPTTWEVMLVILAGMPIYAYYEWKNNDHQFKQALRGSWWLICYLIVMAGLSVLGAKEFGGLNWLHYPWDLVIVAIISIGFYYWGVHSAYAGPDLDQAAQINQRAQIEE